MLLIYNFTRSVAHAYAAQFGRLWETNPGLYVSIHSLAVKSGIRPEVEGETPWETPLSWCERKGLVVTFLKNHSVTPRQFFTCREKEIAEELACFLRDSGYTVSTVDGRSYCGV